MAQEDGSVNNCFTYIWNLENASHCWMQKGENIYSPPFTVDESERTKLRLTLRLRNGPFEDMIGFLLQRVNVQEDSESVEIYCELAFLSADGTCLKTYKSSILPKRLGKFESYGSPLFMSRLELFHTRRSEFLPQNILTARCRLWQNIDETWKNVQCFARSRVAVEKRSFMWHVGNFSTLEPDTKQTYEIKSLDTCEKLVCLELFVNEQNILDGVVRLAITPNYQIIKTCSFHLFVVDVSKNLEEYFYKEFWFNDPDRTKEFPVFLERKLVEKKSMYLPNDVLSLRCKFSYAPGIVFHETVRIIALGSNEPNYHRLLNENDLQTTKCIFIGNLKCMLNNGELSDVKLKTRSKTFFAHTAILAAQSPVFKAMFSHHMKEKLTDCVEIEDISVDTLTRLLRYFYSSEVEEMEWYNATNLYEASDRYEVLGLKERCACFLKTNLRPTNACEALVLADLHHDLDLKRFVQDFIIREGEKIINSEEWEKLMETHLKLAAETMRLKFKMLEKKC